MLLSEKLFCTRIRGLFRDVSDVTCAALILQASRFKTKEQHVLVIGSGAGQQLLLFALTAMICRWKCMNLASKIVNCLKRFSLCVPIVRIQRVIVTRQNMYQIFTYTAKELPSILVEGCSHHLIYLPLQDRICSLGVERLLRSLSGGLFTECVGEGRHYSISVSWICKRQSLGAGYCART